MKKLSFLFLLTSSMLFAQEFPSLDCKDINDKAINLPNDTKGKYTLLCMAYSKKAEEHLQSWFEPVYTQFIYVPEKPSMFYEPFDINTYFVPMFSGVKKVAAGSFKNQVKKDVDPKLHDHILLYKGNISEVKDTYDMPDKNEPYLFLLNEKGEVVYKTSGAYTEEKIIEIEDLIEGE